MTSPSPPVETGTSEGDVRRCRQCGRPLRSGARAEARFCDRACKAAARRARAHHAEAVAIGFAVILDGRRAEGTRACPVCGRRFVPGHPRRRDQKYDKPSCRTAAWRKRVREDVTSQRVRGAVNKATVMNDAEPLTSGNTAQTVEHPSGPPP